MSPRCPQCGAGPGPIELPVCPRCGTRLAAPPAAAPVAEPAAQAEPTSESRATLAARYFTPAVAYRPSLLGYLVELGAPYLIPAATYALTLTADGSNAPSWLWLRWASTALAVVVCLTVAVARRPGRLAIVLDARGVRSTRGRHGWPELLSVSLAHNPRGSRVEALHLAWRDGSRTAIPRQLAATARLSSLPNLAALLDEVRRAP
ncbi:MAG: hypothetical protein HZB16_12230 [Armatimonadetes bacterium]|nr:hypothetical protein [Armatimonadota bacterium]